MVIEVKNVLFQKPLADYITADGHDALSIFEDPMEHIACEILKEACRKQFEIVGITLPLVCIPKLKTP
jgi:hypothetical protein